MDNQNSFFYPFLLILLSLKHPEILHVQEKIVRKIISELKNFDNLYDEVCNEPPFGDLPVLEEWEQ